MIYLHKSCTECDGSGGVLCEPFNPSKRGYDVDCPRCNGDGREPMALADASLEQLFSKWIDVNAGESIPADTAALRKWLIEDLS